MTGVDFAESTGLTVGGFLLALACETVREAWRFRRELKENNHIDLSGFDWIAVWQASVNGQEVINSERIAIRQKGGLVKMWNQEKSAENPIGGYKWEGQLQFFHGRDLMGHYFAQPQEQNTNKGIMFFNYNAARKEFIGRWVGASYDGPLTSGFCVISKSKEKSKGLIDTILATHPDKVPIIFQTI